MPLFTLCKDTGVLARDGQCVAHGGDACLGEFVPVDAEWGRLRAQRDEALALAELIERGVSKMISELSTHNKRWRTGRRSLLGEYIPAPLEDR